MTPYYDENGFQIYHGDARLILPQLQRSCIDCVVTDPPYSLRTHRGARSNRCGIEGKSFIDFDPVTAEDISRIFELSARQLDGWLISFMDWRHLAKLAESPPDNLRFVRFGIWDKPNGTPQLSGDRPAMGWEAIGLFHSFGGKMKWNGGGHRAVWQCPRARTPTHPAQKPLSLLKRLIALFANENSLILDPFMGSGTTLHAAKETQCRGIGIETDERYCEIAANRLRQGYSFEPSHKRAAVLLKCKMLTQ